MSINNTNKLEQALDYLDFPLSSGNDTLLFVNAEINTLNPKQIFSLETASHFKATAVYFRTFENLRDPIPQIYIYDNTKGIIDEKEYAHIHRNLWSSCIVPIFIIIEQSQVLIFDTRKPVETFMGQISASPIDKVEITANALKEYSSKLFDNGTFWEQEKYNNFFLDSTSAYNDLIGGLKKIRRSFLEKTNLPEKTAHKLLVLSILVKYLEERGNDEDALFAKDFFKQFGADDFCGVLRQKGQIVKLFSKLALHFNGKIFSWDDKKEVAQLRDADLSLLASFLDANTDGNQYVLWRRYSFNHLPVELISCVYEEFLGQQTSDVVYTPDFLVDMLIDECMPLDDPKDNFKLIDVSCGSGIFLVSSYKRLIEWWRYSEYLKTKKLPPAPDLAKLKLLLKSSIFGVDIQGDATRLTIFSLALALCDMLTPKQIWTELQFDDLSNTNIINCDFFEYLHTEKRVDFDLVIGNPPFIELKTEQFKSLVNKYNIIPDCKIPQNQIALLFLQQAMKLLKSNGNLCLIMPASPLLYNDTLEFRKTFFSNYKVSQILDFTSLSSILFGKANVATAAIFVSKLKPTDDDILHVTVRRTKPAKERIFFEIDHYDFHRTPYTEAINDKYIWKSNLLGGGRVNTLINRLSKLRCLKQFLYDKKATNGWVIGEGFSVGNRANIAPYITGKRTVRMDDFDEMGIHKYSIEKETHFEAPRKANRLIFKKPHILIKEVVTNNTIPIVFLNSDLTFTNRVVGVHAPQKDIQELRRVFNILKKNSKLNVFYLAATSNQFLIGKASALLKKDIDNIPFPVNSDDLKLSFAEKIIRDDILNYRLEHLNKGEAARINNDAERKNLSDFSNTFCKALNSVYAEKSKKFQLHSILESKTFFSLSFHYSSKVINEPSYFNSQRKEDSVASLVHRETGKNLRINRVIKVYERDKVHLIKPKQQYYWLKSIALRDADEIFDDLLKAGY